MLSQFVFHRIKLTLLVYMSSMTLSWLLDHLIYIKLRRNFIQDNFERYSFKWPCARNTGRSGSGKNQKS